MQTFQMATDMYFSHFLFQELQQLKTDLEQVLALTQDLINAQLGASAGKGWVLGVQQQDILRNLQK